MEIKEIVVFVHKIPPLVRVRLEDGLEKTVSNLQETKNELLASGVVPIFILGIERAPEEWQNFASECNVPEVYLVDNPAFKRSIRMCNTNHIYVNTRGTYWDNLVKLFRCKTFTEAVTLRFLHEIGHVVHNHPPQPGISVTGGQTLFPLDSFENQAWCYALTARDKMHDLFAKLQNAFQKWTLLHRFCKKDWPDSLLEAYSNGWPLKNYLAWPAHPELKILVEELVKNTK